MQDKRKQKFTDLVENEIKELKSVKVSFGLKVEFSIERNGETQYMERYFREEEPHVFNGHDKELIKEEFDRFVERAKGEIEGWSAKGSGWVLERIMLAYVNVARRNLFAYSSQSGKKESDNQRAKQG